MLSYDLFKTNNKFVFIESVKMTKKTILLILSTNFIFAQINPEAIDIVRDNYGIPHIFSKTDAEVAYGLA